MLRLLTEAAPLFQEGVSHRLRGIFHNELAIALRRLGTAESRQDYHARSIIEYTAAAYHFEQARLERHVGLLENNLAFLLYKLGCYREAHGHLDRAQTTFTRLRDARSLAHVDETRARVLVAERRYRDAERTLAGVLKTLEKGDESALLADALTFQGVIRARLWEYQNSIGVLRRAAEGMRKTTEFLRLQIEHVNFGDSPVFFNINGKDVEVLPDLLLVVESKNKKPRTVTMTARVRSELLQVIQGRTEGPVFSSARTGVSLVEIKKGFKRACELAGIPHGQTTPGGLTFHDLRHTFATRLAERGVGETARMALLGQSSTKMVRRYSHATPEAIREAVQRFEQRAGEVLEFRRRAG